MPFENVASYAQQFRDEAERRRRANQPYEESVQSDLNYRRQDVKNAGATFKALEEFAPSIKELIKVKGLEQVKNAKIEGENIAREREEDEDERRQNDLRIAELEQDKERNLEELEKLKSKYPNELEAIDTLVDSLSPTQQIGFYAYRGKVLSQQVYPAEIQQRYQNALKEDPTIARDEVKQRAVIRALTNEFVVENFPTDGKQSIRLRQEHVYKHLDVEEANFIRSINKKSLVDKGTERRHKAKLTLAGTKDIKGYFRELGLTTAADGKGFFSKSQTWEQLKVDTLELINANQLEYKDIIEMGEQEIPGMKGMLFKDHPRFVAMKKALVTNTINDARLLKQQGDALATSDADNIIQTLLQSKELPSKAEVEEIYEAFQKRNNYREDTKLRKFLNNYNSSAEKKKSDEERAQFLFNSGLLDDQALSTMDVSVQQVWKPRLQLQGSAKSHKENHKSLGQEIKVLAKIGVDGDLGAVPKLIHQELVSYYNQLVQDKVAANIPPQIAASQAVIETVTYLKDNGGDKAGRNVNREGKYFHDGSGFKNYERTFKIKHGVSATNAAVKLSNIRSSIATFGLEKTLNKKDAIWTTNELIEMEEGFGRPGWKLPPMALLLSQETGSSVFKLINKARKASGLEDLKIADKETAAVIELLEVLSKPQQRLIRFQSTPNRAFRALMPIDTLPLRTP